MDDEWIVELQDADSQREFSAFVREYLLQHDLENSIQLQEIHAAPPSRQVPFQDFAPVKELVLIGSSVISALAVLLPAFIDRFGRRRILIKRTRQSETIDLTGLNGDEAAAVIRELHTTPPGKSE